MVEGARLESVYTATYRGFESLPLCEVFYTLRLCRKLAFVNRRKVKKEKQKFHFCFKDFDQRMLERSDSNPGYYTSIYKTDSILFLANEQAPSIPAFSPSFDIFNLVSVFTKLKEYLLIALLVGRRK